MQPIFFHLIKKIIASVLSVSILFLGISCSYYKATTLNGNLENGQITHLNDKFYRYEDSYFIVHFGNESWQMNDIIINGSEGYMTAKLSEVHPTIEEYYQLIENKSYKRYYSRDCEYIRQIHLYITEYSMEGDEIKFTENSLEQVEVLDPSFGLTTLSYVAVGGGTLFIAFLIFLYIVCNCPHVYTYDGETYQFNYTLFTGAVSQKLERSDYQVMPDLYPEVSDYQLLIKNDEDERQFTDQLQLRVAHHARDIQVFPDQYGELHAISSPLSPSVATSACSKSELEKLKLRDDLPFKFDRVTDKLSHLDLTFPGGGDKAALIVRVKNSLWGGLVYHEFQGLFGHRYQSWVENNQDKSADELLDWQKKQGILMKVEVKRDQKWEVIEYISLVGEAGYNSLAVSLEGLEIGKETQIRLSSGFKFWEIDYAALAYSEESIVDLQELSPVLAFDQDGSDQSLTLARDDGVYMEHLKKGDSALIRFEGLKNIPGMARTIILKSDGYYKTNKNVSGKTKYLQLVKLRKGGEFSVFSKELYDELSSSTIRLN